MEGSFRKKRLAPRSRSGCLPCRRHHRKCDEQRPECALCRKNNRTCDYGLSIKWGGRPFRNSAFGLCLSGTNGQSTPVGKIQIGHEHVDDMSRYASPFVYGIIVEQPNQATVVTATQEISLPTPIPSSAVARDLELQDISRSTSNHQEETLLRVTPTPLPDLPPAYRSLLDYFTHAIDSFSCDEVVKRDFCSTFLPMAFSTSHVMASILNLAAVHRANAGLAQDSKQLALLQVVSVEQLRSKLTSPSSPPTEAVMATILMMCYSEIVAGGKNTHSWRLHLEGAASLFNRDLSAWTTHSPNPTHTFIAKCFVSLVALANMSGCPPSESVSSQAVYMSGGDSENDGIDEFTAYSAGLLHIFVEIGALLRERERATTLSGSRSLEERSSEVARKLRGSTRQRQANMDVRASATLSPVRMREFTNINKAYHQAALLHIYQRIQRLSPSEDQVQSIVHRILVLISGVEFPNGACPGIVLLFPLFSAGCGAVHSADRQRVRTLLQKMVRMYQIVAVQHSIKVLEALWAHRDEHGESDANTSWERFIDEGIDLILY